VSTAKLFTYLGFAVWVSVCAAAPEFIWQGLLELIGHFSLETALSIVLVGLILAVFIEPILVRARVGRWHPEHRSKRSLLFTAPIAFVFGVVAVGLHECMTAYLGAAGEGHGAGREGMIRAAGLILEWACIPLAVTMAWFGARLDGRGKYVAAAVAAVWVVAAGLLYGWPAPGIYMTFIPCLALIPMGQIYVLRGWHENTFQNLAIGLAGGTGLFLLATLVLQSALPWLGFAEVRLYAPGDFGESFRFYLGWALGLALAPNPVSTRLSTTDEIG
jgi:hypothetical protein